MSLAGAETSQPGAATKPKKPTFIIDPETEARLARDDGVSNRIRSSKRKKSSHSTGDENGSENMPESSEGEKSRRHRKRSEDGESERSHRSSRHRKTDEDGEESTSSRHHRSSRHRSRTEDPEDAENDLEKPKSRHRHSRHHSSSETPGEEGAESGRKSHHRHSRHRHRDEAAEDGEESEVKSRHRHSRHRSVDPEGETPDSESASKSRSSRHRSRSHRDEDGEVSEGHRSRHHSSRHRSRSRSTDAEGEEGESSGRRSHRSRHRSRSEQPEIATSETSGRKKERLHGEAALQDPEERRRRRHRRGHGVHSKDTDASEGIDDSILSRSIQDGDSGLPPLSQSETARALMDDESPQSALPSLSTSFSLLAGSTLAAADLDKEKLKREEAEKKRLAEEAEKKRLAEEEEKKRFAEEEAEKKRLAEEEEKKRLAEEEAEKKRLAEEEEKKRLAEEEEKRRLEEEAEKKRLAEEEAEKKRLAEEEEKKRLAEEAEKKRLAEEEAEKKRLAEEEAEKKRLAEEEEENEKRRLAAEANERKKLIEKETENERLMQEEAERKRIFEESERQRLAAEAAMIKAQTENAEKQRLAAEEAERQRIAAEEAEKKRLAAEEKKKLAEELERKRLAEQAEKKARAVEEERRRLVAEQENARKLLSEEAQQRLLIEEAARKRLAEDLLRQKQEELERKKREENISRQEQEAKRAQIEERNKMLAKAERSLLDQKNSQPSSIRERSIPVQPPKEPTSSSSSAEPAGLQKKLDQEQAERNKKVEEARQKEQDKHDKERTRMEEEFRQKMLKDNERRQHEKDLKRQADEISQRHMSGQPHKKLQEEDSKSNERGSFRRKRSVQPQSDSPSPVRRDRVRDLSLMSPRIQEPNSSGINRRSRGRPFTRSLPPLSSPDSKKALTPRAKPRNIRPIQDEDLETLESLRVKILNDEDPGPVDVKTANTVFTELQTCRDELVSQGTFRDTFTAQRAIDHARAVHFTAVKRHAQKEFYEEIQAKKEVAQNELDRIEHLLDCEEQDLDQKYEQLIKTIKDRHMKELREHDAGWQSETRQRSYTKISVRLRNMRLQQEKLLLVKRYDEAEEVAKIADSISEQETAEAAKALASDFLASRQALLKRHSDELESIYKQASQKKDAFQTYREAQLHPYIKRIQVLETEEQTAEDPEKVWALKHRNYNDIYPISSTPRTARRSKNCPTLNGAKFLTLPKLPTLVKPNQIIPIKT